MALFKYFKISLPTAKDTGMSETVTRETNAAVSQILTPTQQSTFEFTENNTFQPSDCCPRFKMGLTLQGHASFPPPLGQLFGAGQRVPV